MVNSSSFGNWLLLSVFQQKTQQFSNLFHTFEEMPPPFKNLKSCKVDLSVLVILSWSPPVLWIKEISHFRLPSVSILCSIPPWRGESCWKTTGRSSSGVSVTSASVHKQKTWRLSLGAAAFYLVTSKWRKINQQNKQPVHKQTIWIISLTEGLSVRRDKKA